MIFLGLAALAAVWVGLWALCAMAADVRQPDPEIAPWINEANARAAWLAHPH